MSLEFIEPQLATSIDHPPPRAGWIHEVKHDGYRTLLILERHKARAYTRNGYDWTDRYPGIAKAAAKLDCRSAIIDGEVIVQNERGVSDFERAQIRDPLATTKPDLLRFQRQGFARPTIARTQG
jgi:bifunctional non-homologous end joining protein LigD